MPQTATMISAASCCSVVNVRPGRSVCGGGGGRSAETCMLSSISAFAIAVITPVPTSAMRASSAALIAPASPRTSSTCWRAGVMRIPSGMILALVNSLVCGGVCKARGWLSTIFATAPIGAKVQAAIRSIKLTNASLSAGNAATALMAFNFSGATSPVPTPSTMPATIRPPKGTVTIVPRLISVPV